MSNNPDNYPPGPLRIPSVSLSLTPNAPTSALNIRSLSSFSHPRSVPPSTTGVHLVPVSVPIPVLSNTTCATSTTFYKPVTITPAAPLRIPAPPKAPSAVTIQKATPKTISLPYNTTPSHLMPQIVTSPLPIARVVPQPMDAMNLSTEASRRKTAPARVVSIPSLVPSVSVTPVNSAGIPSAITAILQSKDFNVGKSSAAATTRPGILRRREGERGELLMGNQQHHVGEHTTMIETNNNREDESLSSGSTTLSATSSPGFGYHSGGEEQTLVTFNTNAPPQANSPRKKPRKQNFNALIYNEEEEEEEEEEDLTNRQPLHKRRKATVDRRKRHQLLSSYHAPWKTCHNHFLRHSDVKTKDEASASIRPTVHELISTHRYISQQINGWKIHHLSAQMEDVTLMETELTERLSELQRRLECSAHSEINLSKVQEMIKANLQRSKIVRDQVGESKSHLMNIFDHKPKIMDIINKYVNKRHVRREIV